VEALGDQVREVIAAMATIPNRLKTLEESVRSLLPQVDRLCVYLNGHTEIPSFLKMPKVEIVTSRDHGDHSDAGKFWWSNKVHGYYLSTDDDLIYPPNYVETLIGKIELYHRKVAVGVCGNLIRLPFKSYLFDKIGISFRTSNSKDRQVHVLGTGTTAYHTDTIGLSPLDFKGPGMADIWFAVAAQKQSIPLIVIAHPKDWLVMSCPMQSDSLWATRRRYMQEVDHVILQNMPWQLPAVNFHVLPK